PKSSTTRVAVPEALRSARLGMPVDVYEASLRAGVSARLKSFGLPDASRHEAERAARQASLEARLVTPHVARETLLAASMATHSCHACSHRAA
ncbi:MAG: hypothetical protein EBY98_06360, partial [Acidimicrobiia bacterium]|nr:hypothetical protein [Acidimicrobiia bacterium]